MKYNPIYKLFLSIFFLLSGLVLQAQWHSVQGKVLNSKSEIVPFASIRVKELQSGTTSKQDGSYELILKTGVYQLEVSIIGYKSQQIELSVQDNIQRNIILEEEPQSLTEIVVRAKVKDRAEEIMRQVICKKDSIQSAAGSYSYQLYIKSVLQKENNSPSLTSSGKTDKEERPNLSLAEILSRVDVVPNKQIKEERLAVRGNSKTKGMFYLSATEGTFDFYNNQVYVPAISPTPFLSPISKSGLVAYQFKTIKTKRIGKHRIYTFSVKPLQVTNATVEGELTVSDSAWVVLHARLRFPSYHLQEFDFFEVEQDFDFINNQAWMLTRQKFTYQIKGRKKEYAGQTVATYSNYELNKEFGRRYFNSEVSATAKEAYDKDSTFWNKARTEPLSEQETLQAHYDDRLITYAKTDQYLDSLDRLVNRITWQKLGIFGQSLQDHKKERTWHFSPLASLYQPFAFGGGRLNVSAYYAKTFTSRKYLSVNTNLSYGFRNNDVNGSIEVYRRYNPFNRGFYTLEAGRDFAFINEGDAWINMIQRNNFYLNNYVGAGHGLEVLNGLVISTDVQMAFRKSVDGYQTGKLADSLLIDIVDNNQAVSFKPYNALYGRMKIQYTPGQRYRREPKEKIIIGSQWPTFYALWEKGVRGLADSEVDFDYLEFGIEQSLNLGLVGVSRYTIKTGEYLNTKDLRFIDYKFQRRGDPLLFMNPYKSFQALDSSFAVFDRYVEGHLFHEFNGLFINKVPLLKKLKLREVGGAGLLVAPERNLRYGELYVGLERAFQSPFNPLDKFKIGVYIVNSFSNQFRDPAQFKVGFTTWDKRKNRWF